jgi:hypothetical protein
MLVVMPHLVTLMVLQSRGSWRDSTSRLWSFEEAEFSLDAEVHPSSSILHVAHSTTRRGREAC